jgi:hypothetical protein
MAAADTSRADRGVVVTTSGPAALLTFSVGGGADVARWAASTRLALQFRRVGSVEATRDADASQNNKKG